MNNQPEEKTWYKVLDSQCDSIHGEKIIWTLKDGGHNGMWIDVPTGPGIFLTTNPASQLKEGYHLFKVEIEGEFRIKNPSTALARRVRFTRELDWFILDNTISYRKPAIPNLLTVMGN